MIIEFATIVNQKMSDFTQREVALLYNTQAKLLEESRKTLEFREENHKLKIKVEEQAEEIKRTGRQVCVKCQVHTSPESRSVELHQFMCAYTDSVKMILEHMEKTGCDPMVLGQLRQEIDRMVKMIPTRGGVAPTRSNLKIPVPILKPDLGQE